MYVLIVDLSCNHGNGFIDRKRKTLTCDSLKNLFISFEKLKIKTDYRWDLSCILYQKDIIHVQEVDVSYHETFKKHPYKTVLGDFFVFNHDDMKYITSFNCSGENYNE